jgi:hypothetical protein
VILCIGSAADDTFLYLLAKIRERRATVAVDVIQLALTGSFILRPGGGTLAVAGREIRLSEISGCWIRLPGVHSMGPDPHSQRLVAGTERSLEIALNYLPAPVVNPPLLEPSNFSKPAHLLYLAAAAGFAVPESCATNDPEQAKAFIDKHDGRVVYKGMSSTKTWVRRWDPESDLSRLDLIRPTPVFFQRLITGPDVRAHVAAGTIHAERIDSAAIDYRTSHHSNTYRSITCPDETAEACLRLSATMNCPLLGVDFKIDDRTGRWVILEANTLPCFQGYDRRANGAISRAILNYLTADAR